MWPFFFSFVFLRVWQRWKKKQGRVVGKVLTRSDTSSENDVIENIVESANVNLVILHF